MYNENLIINAMRSLMYVDCVRVAGVQVGALALAAGNDDGPHDAEPAALRGQLAETQPRVDAEPREQVEEPCHDARRLELRACWWTASWSPAATGDGAVAIERDAAIAERVRLVRHVGTGTPPAPATGVPQEAPSLDQPQEARERDGRYGRRSLRQRESRIEGQRSRQRKPLH